MWLSFLAVPVVYSDNSPSKKTEKEKKKNPSTSYFKYKTNDRMKWIREVSFFIGNAVLRLYDHLKKLILNLLNNER